MATLIGYGILAIIASLAGGWIPLLVRLTHRRMQIAISLVGGMMLGVGLLHLLPHAEEKLHSLDDAVLWALVGFLLMFFLERFFHFHHHDAPDTESGGPHDPHSHCDHAHHHDHAPQVHGLAWLGASLGLTLHSLIDGMALAAAVAADQDHAGSAVPLAGMGAALAILLHKPFDSLSLGTLLAAGRLSRGSQHLVNLLHSLVLPCGMALFFIASQKAGLAHEQFLGRALALACGTFLCIATSDLLPEVQFHSHDRLKLSLALLVGVGLSYAIGFLETSGHHHHHAEGASVSAEPHSPADHEHEDHDHDHDHDHHEDESQP